MNKNVLFRYPGIPLILILLLIFLTACTPGENIAGGEKVAVEGKIIAMEGRVLLNSREAAPGDAVPDKAVITTDETGYCEVTFLESNIIRIFESSIMKISFSEAMLGVERGTAAAVLRNIASLLREDRPFQVESGNVVAGIRGTSFFLKREDTESTYFCLCNGAVEVHDPAGTPGAAHGRHPSQRYPHPGTERGNQYEPGPHW